MELPVSLWLSVSHIAATSGRMSLADYSWFMRSGRIGDRGSIERCAIALLSNYSKAVIDPPSAGWLGNLQSVSACDGPACGTTTTWMKDTNQAFSRSWYDT